MESVVKKGRSAYAHCGTSPDLVIAIAYHDFDFP